MSFFRNIRSTITRGKSSSSRDTTPVRAGSRPVSITSRASVDSSRPDSANFNRSDTFILGGSDQEQEQQQRSQSNSNSSTLEKKSKKSKVLSKFSTFTKRKKTPSPESGAYEHHPSDNATNTYYKWKSEGPTQLDYDAQSDPFNCLYERQSSLKHMQQHSSGGSGNGDGRGSAGISNVAFDSSTYRKDKMPARLKAQLEQLKNCANVGDTLPEEEDEREKYKTVTLNSFRRSFREKLLQQQQNQAPHNPAWFVQVEQPADTQQSSQLRERGDSKENRPDFLVFENDNYRPGTRSPVRDRSVGGRSSRSSTRSPVKRNETFRVERPTGETPSPTSPSIRIEIKNSIAPNMPGRLVPVGVAKPMPAADHYRPLSLSQSSAAAHTRPANQHAAPRNWSKPPTEISPHRRPQSNSHGSGHYQTLVQIRNEANTPLPPRSRLYTRIQLSGSPTAPKRFGFGSSVAANQQQDDMLAHAGKTAKAMQSTSPPQYYAKPQHTYFGDAPLQHHHRLTTAPARFYSSSGYAPVVHSSKAQQQQQQQQQHHQQPQQQRQLSATATGAGGFLSRRELHQPRYVVPTQRRSRSPIKIPWR